MALQTIPGGGIWIPQPWHPFADSFGATTLDAAADRCAMIFRVPKTGTLDKFEFRTGTVTAADDLRASFQDVNASGDPDDVEDQFRSIPAASVTSNTWIVPGLMTSDGTDAGVKRSVTRGDVLAAVIRIETFVDGNLQINVHNATDSNWGGFPYIDSNTTGAYSKLSLNQPLLALKYDDGTYAFIGGHSYPFLAPSTTISLNTGTNPDEVGNIFRLPFPCKIGGAWFALTQAAAADFDIIIYDSDGITALTTQSTDGDLGPTTAKLRFHCFDAEVQLSANTDYRMAIKPTTATSITARYSDINAAAIMDAIEGGQNWQYTSRVDAGAWSQITTRRLHMGLLVTAVDDGVGGGGRANIIGG